jgi:deazaflavin-dependent oxidoreductase (nitroreductase family)
MRRLHRFGYLMLGELATTRLFYALHRVIYRLSGGRIFSRSLGCPVVLLNTTGRKSGDPRTAPIFGFRKGESIVVVPSNAEKKHTPRGISTSQPSCQPSGTSPFGAGNTAVKAREATSEERERLLPFLASQYDGYQVYRERTDRPIPVIILEPV